MSGGMIKIGIFGICKVCFDLLGAAGGEVGWGVLVIVIGAVSSVLGVVYALGEHDLKSLLAYHSVENIGIILLGVGVGIYGRAARPAPGSAAIGLLAGLYHLVNHAMFKGLLFLGAGSVLHATGTRNMEVLGGLAKAMPITAVCFLIGSLPFRLSHLSTASCPSGSPTRAHRGGHGRRYFHAYRLRLCRGGPRHYRRFGGHLLREGLRRDVLARPRSGGGRACPRGAGSHDHRHGHPHGTCIALGLGAAWVAPVIGSIASSMLAAPSLPVVEGATLVSLDTVSGGLAAHHGRSYGRHHRPVRFGA